MSTLHINSDIMPDLKKDKILLLRTLRNLVTENVNYADVSELLDSEIAEHLMELKDKRRLRRLKKVGKALDELIEETVRDNQLREEERKFNEAKLKESVKNATERFNSDQ